MKLMKLNIFIGFLFIGLLVSSCNEKGDDTVESTDNFNRSELLSFWADDVIIPAYNAFDGTLTNLVDSKNAFISNPSTGNLETLKSNWLNSYKAWQSVSMFDIGKAEEIGFRNYINIYPSDVALIEAHIASGDYNLTLPSTFDAQGFPALDYLLFGLSDDTTEQLNMLSQANYNSYLSDLIDRMKTLNEEVLTDWESGYRDTFVANDGSSATASTDKMVNDFLYYFEKFFRAGKIGIPAGVFSGTEISSSVEAPYSAIYSKALFFEAFDAIHDFFTGNSFDKSTTGQSLQQYLSSVAQTNETQDFSISILQKWEVAFASAENLQDNLKEQVELDNAKMLNTYDEIQKSVVLMKVDMMSALNIQVDYVDADGD